MVVFLSILATLSGFTIFFAYTRLMFTGTPVVRYLSTSIALLSAAFILRTIYWDLIPDEFREWMLTYIPYITRSFMNSIFNLIFVVAAGYGSAAIHEMLPEDDRSRWNKLTAWLYPPLWTRRKK